MDQRIAYIILCIIFLISLILTSLVVFFSKRSTIHNSFIFKLIMNLIIVSTIHSFSYILTYVEDNVSIFGEVLCQLQSIMLMTFCQIQEIWVIVITIFSFKGVIQNKYYNIKKNRNLFILILVLVYGIFPGILLSIYISQGALGMHIKYCWVKESKQIYSYILFILKHFYVAANLVITIALFVGACVSKNNSGDYDKRKRFCFKTSVFSLIQLIINIPMTIIRLTSTDINIGSFISSSSGIFYPIFIAWYTEIICPKIERTDTQDTTEEAMETTMALINEDLHKEENNVKMNSSIDYYS